MGNSRKGIILAGGSGTRLYPITKSISKQLIPIYDKPMIFYPLTTLMLAGIREILIITNPQYLENFKSLLGNGSHLGISIEYLIQEFPNGLAEAFILGESFIGDSLSALILGDNLYHGQGLRNILNQVTLNEEGASIFAYKVNEPERYGIIEFDSSLKVISIEEKPTIPKSRFACTGLYFFDRTVVEKAKSLKPSKRGELEITDLNNLYLKENKLYVEPLGRGMVWLDTGTFDSLHEACSYIRTIEHRQGLKVGCPEEVAWRLGWINDQKLENLADKYLKSGYGSYLKKILNE